MEKYIKPVAEMIRKSGKGWYFLIKEFYFFRTGAKVCISRRQGTKDRVI